MEASESKAANETTPQTKIFAFDGFPKGHPEHRLFYELICEYVRDYLANFSLTVIGTNSSQGQVAVEYVVLQREALFKSLHEHRDRFAFEQVVLTVREVDTQWRGIFTVPDALPDASMGVGGGRPETFYTATPPRATQRSDTVHSGITPDLANKRQTLNDFLNVVPETKSIVPPPMPGQEVDPTMQAILDGVNELRANTVTRATLREFQQLQSEEMRTFVRAETAPLHNAVGQLNDDVSQIRAQVAVLEAGSSPGETVPGPNPFDPALRQVTFADFPGSATTASRIAAMEQFMQANFPEVRCIYDHFVDKNGDTSKNSYVQVGEKKVARKILKRIKDQKLKLQNYNGVKIKPALTEIDRHRNWALFTAEDLVKKSPKSDGKDVEVKKGDGRGVYVNKVPVFSQPGRYSRGGVFHGEYAGMKLP